MLRAPPSRSVVALAMALVMSGTLAGRTAYAKPPDPKALERARVLDQQGVRAYKEDRYNDAIRYFSEAWKLGGPPSELWNIAKCYARLDEPEESSRALEEYLEQPGLSPSDRAEATEQLREIKRRHSTLTVASSPSGANVYLDGHRASAAGTTPVSLDIAPGSHSVTVEHAGYEAYTKQIEASYGRAVIVDAQLAKSDDDAAPPRDKAAPAPSEAHAHRVILGATFAGTFPKYGGVGGVAHVAGMLSAHYVLYDKKRLLFGIGARFALTGDSWGNTVGADAQPANCGAPIPSKEGATAFSAFVDGLVGYRLTSRIRVGGDVGLGIATTSLDYAGGDVYTPTCRPSPGAKPAVHLGAEASYAFSRDLRLTLTPLYLELQPSFEGTRTSPKDASSLWLRVGFGLGLAFDVF